MEGKKTQPRALLVFGAPCSGKSTFAKKFAEKFNIAYYNFDDIKKAHNFSSAGTLAILELVARTHQTIVMEGLIGTEQNRGVVRQILAKAGYDVTLIWVQTDIATIRSRMKAKYKSVAKAKTAYDTIVAKLEAPTEAENPIILSGKHTFETQTKHVLAGLADVDKR